MVTEHNSESLDSATPGLLDTPILLQALSARPQKLASRARFFHEAASKSSVTADRSHQSGSRRQTTASFTDFCTELCEL